MPLPAIRQQGIARVKPLRRKAERRRKGERLRRWRAAALRKLLARAVKHILHTCAKLFGQRFKYARVKFCLRRKRLERSDCAA